MIARLLISPDLDLRVKEIASILATTFEKEGINHPDLLYFKDDSKLGIEQARNIKTHLSLKPYSAHGRGVILETASNLTLEAQNALLKTLEELPNKALFILGVKSELDLLPTVLSRCQIIHLDPGSHKTSKSEKEVNSEIEKLLSFSTEERFFYVEKLKDKDQFLKDLVFYFHQDPKQYALFLAELLQAEKWANQNVNIRAILEYLMLIMPSK